MSVRVIVFLTLTISFAAAETSDRPHLTPIGPNFGVDAPHASIYASLCEKMLFAGPNWVIRYHEISESAETGLSITRTPDGRFWVTSKQTRPQLGSTVFSALDNKVNLKSALNTLKHVEGRAEIPESVVTEIRRYWLSLLSDVRPRKRAPSSVIISNRVLLFAKTPNGESLAGKMPSDAFKNVYLRAAEDIAWDLVEVCVQRKGSPKRLFNRIEQRARESADAMFKRSDE